MSPAILNPAQLLAVAGRESACILAGAGSGKTLTLVEAITHRLEDAWGQETPLDIQEILALTFTDKAAAELRQRLAGAFTERRREADAAGRTALADFWRSQAARLDRADIGTIHSYAFKLVRENAFKLGLPAAPVLDPDETRLARDLDDLFLDWLDGGCQELLRLMKYFPPRTLKELLAAGALRLGSWGLSRLSASTPVTAEEVADRLAVFKELVRETAGLVRGGAIAPGKSYYAPVRAALENISAALASTAPAGLEERLPELRGLLQASGRWYTAHGLKTGLIEALTALEAATGQDLVQPLLEDLLALINQLPKRLARARARRGTINYDDILSLARRLLAANPEVRRLETGRRRLIFIDEFQDTNRLQANLLAYLLLPPDDQTRYPEETDLWSRLDWSAVEPRFNAYGDLKQSIYRFRGAEVEIMASFRSALAQGGGQVLALPRNYRSQPQLVDFFNTLFADRLGEYFITADRQEAVRPALYDGPHIVRLHAAGGKAALVRERAEEEARLLTSYLARLFQGRGGVRVADGSDSGRNPQPGDVAVLFRHFLYAPVFHQAFLKAGWPVRLSQNDSPLDYSEGRGLLAAFSFLSGLDLELNLAAALRSPLGPVTDETLVKLIWPSAEALGPVRLADYFLLARPWPRDLAADDLKVLVEIRTLFSELAPLAGRLQPVEILERLVEERQLLPLAALEPDGEARIRALTGFLALSRTLNSSNQDEFLNPAEELAALGQKEQGPSGLENRAEAITLSTVHKAKGLEFPVVIIAASDSPPRPRGTKVLTSGSGRLALNWRPAGWPTPPAAYLELAEEEDRLGKMENQRLFYVAATRARDHLVFLAQPKTEKEDKKNRGETDNWFQALLDCPAALALSREIILSENPELPAIEAASRAQPEDRGEALDLLAPMTLTSASLSVTELARHLAEAKGAATADLPTGLSLAPVRAPETGSLSASKALTPREAGALFHAVMEILDPRAPHPLELLAAEAARLGLIPGDLTVLATPIEIFLASPWGQAWRAAASDGRAVFREWPFQLSLREGGDPTRHLKINGIIDLFFQTPEGGRIVDYKFTAFPGESGDGGNPLSVYESQVRLYALALTRAGLGEGLKAALYFAGSARPHIHEINLAAGWSPEFWLNFLKNFFKQAQTSHLRL